jgi:hypothetical protein
MSEENLADCIKSIERLQSFDPRTLERKEALGPFAFTNAVHHAQKLVEFFRLIPIDFIKELPDNQIATLKQH